MDIIEFARWQDEVHHRRTVYGYIYYYYIGKIVAGIFIFKLCLSSKNVIYNDYKNEMIGTMTRHSVHFIY